MNIRQSVLVFLFSICSIMQMKSQAVDSISEQLDTTEMRVNYIMSHDSFWARDRTAFMFIEAFRELYGDSIIKKCVKNQEGVQINLTLHNDGHVYSYNIYRASRKKTMLPFFKDKKWEILSKVVERNKYIYFPVGYTYIENLTRSEYKSILFLFPMPTSLEIEFWKCEKDPPQYIEILDNYQLPPIKTSIDVGLHPDDYKKYIYNPKDALPLSVQKGDWTGRIDAIVK